MYKAHTYAYVLLDILVGPSLRKSPENSKNPRVKFPILCAHASVQFTARVAGAFLSLPSHMLSDGGATQTRSPLPIHYMYIYIYT